MKTIGHYIILYTEKYIRSKQDWSLQFLFASPDVSLFYASTLQVCLHTHTHVHISCMYIRSVLVHTHTHTETNVETHLYTQNKTYSLLQFTNTNLKTITADRSMSQN